MGEPEAVGEPREAREVQELLLVSDFNLTNLARVLSNLPGGPSVRATVAPFGSVVQSLLEWRPTGRSEGVGAVVWTRPEAVIPSFGRILEHRSVSPGTLVGEVDAFFDVLRNSLERFRFLVVPTWVAPYGHRGLGMLDFRSDAGLGGALLRMNARLMENASEVPGAFVVDGSRWAASGDGQEAARLWYLGKIPFGPAVFRHAARDVLAAVRGISGQARKVVVVDLDNTLWGGIVGDVGAEGLRLGGHDPQGEAFVDFQRALKALTHRGVVLAIASKNQEQVALDALANHPEMVLRPEDFAAWRINWEDKARNLVELAGELNLGLDAMVFLDDSPSEQARVREALPDVLVPEWPEDPLTYATALRGLDCFDAPSLSEEDAARARMYVAERERRSALDSVGSVEEWLMTLGIRVSAEVLSRENLPRAAQLLNKTNQMNLSTRRLTEEELWAWASEDGHTFWTVRVEDRFGDYGLTGLVSLDCQGSEGRVVDFVLSCRVFGRRVEETMLHVVWTHARRAGLDRLSAHYLETPKNAPCLEFWTQRSGFEHEDPPVLFRRQLRDVRPLPDCVTLVE